MRERKPKVGRPPLPKGEAKAIVWAGSNLCLAVKKDYILLDCESGASSEMLAGGRTGPPLLTLLPDREMLVGKDRMFV